MGCPVYTPLWKPISIPRGPHGPVPIIQECPEAAGATQNQDWKKKPLPGLAPPPWVRGLLGWPDLARTPPRLSSLSRTHSSVLTDMTRKGARLGQDRCTASSDSFCSCPKCNHAGGRVTAALEGDRLRPSADGHRTHPGPTTASQGACPATQ